MPLNAYISFKWKILIIGLILLLSAPGPVMSAEATTETPSPTGHILVPAGEKIGPSSCGFWCENKWWVIIGGIVVAGGAAAAVALGSDDGGDDETKTGTVVYEWTGN